MRLLRSTSICAVACGAALAVATLADAAPPVAKLRGFSCHRSVKPIGRGIAVSAVMRPLAGTRHLALKFELLTRTKPRTAWATVPGGDLGSWLTPRNPTLGQRPGDVWIVNKSVNELAAPAAYRFRVTFRWTGARARLLGTTVRSSATCNEPERRPDLIVRAIDVQPIAGHPRLNLYVVTITNAGATAARHFRVQFLTAAGAAAAQYRTIALLAAHSSTSVRFQGPACTANAPSTVTADPDEAVDDFNRANNTLTAVCSSASGHS